jgi:predicted AlkP superfamily phosphohydrolase/phosphomutase
MIFRRFVISLMCGLALFCVCPENAPARVIVIGIDGASWNAIDPMLEAGTLPNLKSLIDRGGSANLDTVEPVISPVVWTSIATGRSPAAHGVTDFFSTRATISVPTIYERLSAQGKRVGLYEVLMSWPPPPLPNGFVVPGWLRRDETTWPPEATADLPIFRTVYDGKPLNREYLEQATLETTQKAASWNALADRFDPEVAALTYYAVDALSHRYWHSSYPEDFEDEIPDFAQDERHAVQRALRGVDASIGEVTARLDLEGNDNVIVVSDHGFKAADGHTDVWITRFEDLLAKHGLVSGRDGFTLVSTFFAVTIRIAPGSFEARDPLIDKLASLARSYQSLDGDELMLTTILDVAERPAERSRSLYERARQWAVRKFMDVAFDTKVDPTAHAMIVALPKSGSLDPLWPEGPIRVDGEEMPLHQAIYRQRFTGIHDSTAIFIAAGGSIEKQTERHRLSVLDVAPLVAYLAGSGVPDDLEGKLPIDWIKRIHAEKNPPRIEAANELPRLAETLTGDGSDGENVGAEDPALVEKLRALGYIE